MNTVCTYIFVSEKLFYACSIEQIRYSEREFLINPFKTEILEVK